MFLFSFFFYFRGMQKTKKQTKKACDCFIFFFVDVHMYVLRIFYVMGIFIYFYFYFFIILCYTVLYCITVLYQVLYYTSTALCYLCAGFWGGVQHGHEAPRKAKKTGKKMEKKKGRHCTPRIQCNTLWLSLQYGALLPRHVVFLAHMRSSDMLLALHEPQHLDQCACRAVFFRHNESGTTILHCIALYCII